MRSVVLGIAIILAGCARPAPEPAQQVAIAPVPQPEVAPAPREGPLHVPQDPEYLAEIERTRNWQPGVERDLATGRFRYGSKLADVTAEYKPDVLFEHGEYATAVYAEARGHYLTSMGHTYVIAKDGKLVWSLGSSCKWHPVFFNGLTEAERKAWSEGFWKAHKTYIETQSRTWLRRQAGMTIAGPAAAVAHPCQW